MKCPVCGAVYRPPKRNIGVVVQGNHHDKDETVTRFPSASPSSSLSTACSSPTCRRCKADLSDLFRLHDQALWHHKQALHLLTQERYLEATTHNNQAISLCYSNADFHALAGKLWALQGEWKQAISSWQHALKFDPQNAIASNCLQMIQLMAKNHDT
jgi:tetratricopeptide (TPR) repeat protein